MRSLFRGCAAAALLLAVSLAGAAPPELRIDGKRLVDANGEEVRLRGVNAASLEWTSDGQGHIVETVRVAVEDWKVNHVRLPMSQDRWFGKAPEQTDGGVAYRELVDQIIQYCSSKDVYLMAELHWSNGGEWGQRIGQHVMPDEHSVAFWEDFAPRYAGNPAVIYDLYNEPFGVSWEVWRNGGEVTEQFGGGRGTPREEVTFQAVGMQRLYDVVRAIAPNLIVIGGLDYSYDLSGIVDQPLDAPTGNGVLYANHAYPFKGDSVEEWEAKMIVAAETLPLIISEFGSETRQRRRGFGRRRQADQEQAEPQGPPPTPRNEAGLTDREWVDAVLAIMDKHNWHWTAWDLHNGAGPRLISDWDYTPTPNFGVPVKASLLGESAPAE